MASTSVVLNTNVPTIVAQRNFASAQTKLAVAVERMSSGFRINRARDDAAGLAVSSVIDGSTRMAQTATRNVNDAVSMVQTAEGALQEATNILSRLKELATQGANDSMNKNQYQFLAQEMLQGMEELVNLADRTTFNGNQVLGDSGWREVELGNLLQGLSGKIQLTIETSGSAIKAEKDLGAALISSNAAELGRGTASSLILAGTADELKEAISSVKARSTSDGSQLHLRARELGSWANGDFSSGLDSWTAIDSRVRLGGLDTVSGWATPSDSTQAPDGGIEADPLPANVMSFATSVASGAVVMQSSGAPVPNNPVGSGAVVHGPALVSNDALQMKAGTVVSFDWEAQGGADAYDVYGYLLDVDSGKTEVILNQSGGPNAYFQPRTTSSYTVQNDGRYKFVFLSGTWDATKGQAVGAQLIIDNVKAVNPEKVANQRLERLSSWDFISGLESKDAIKLEGIPIWDTASSSAQRNSGRGYADGAVRVGALDALYQRVLWLSDSSNGPLSTGNGFDIFSKSLEEVSGAPDQEVFDANGNLISSLTKSLNELIDDSMVQISGHRSYFGAFAGRIQHNFSNLLMQAENLTAANSRIRDTDYGLETARLTKIQILQQASASMISQANAMPNVVLALLRLS